jgi:hypothetical protein
MAAAAAPASEYHPPSLNTVEEDQSLGAAGLFEKGKPDRQEQLMIVDA